jgi:hypothetical protein
VTRFDRHPSYQEDLLMETSSGATDAPLGFESRLWLAADELRNRRGGQLYTPQCVVRVLAEMLAPHRGRVFDPCCGSGGMFVQSERFIEKHGGHLDDISIYGQESNLTTWRPAERFNERTL